MGLRGLLRILAQHKTKLEYVGTERTGPEGPHCAKLPPSAPELVFCHFCQQKGCRHVDKFVIAKFTGSCQNFVLLYLERRGRHVDKFVVTCGPVY